MLRIFDDGSRQEIPGLPPDDCGAFSSFPAGAQKIRFGVVSGNGSFSEAQIRDKTCPKKTPPASLQAGFNWRFKNFNRCR